MPVDQRRGPASIDGRRVSRPSLIPTPLPSEARASTSRPIATKSVARRRGAVALRAPLTGGYTCAVAQLASDITSDRLTLRRFLSSDLVELNAIYSDPLVARYQYWSERDTQQSREALERHIARPIALVEDNVLPVAVVLSENGRLIGDFMLRWAANEHRQGEIGGSLSRDVHGRGYATEVFRELLNVGFRDFGLHRIVGRCDARNGPSIRALEKAGLRREAHFRENEFVKNEWTDEVVLALRYGEWTNDATSA